MEDYLIEEYKTLREEVIKLEREQLMISFYVLTISIAAAGLIEKFPSFNEVIPIIFQIVLLWGMERYLIAARLRVKISTYIKAFLEPKISGINWERQNIKFKEDKSFRQNKWFRRFTNLFTLLYLLGIYVIYQYIATLQCINVYEFIIVDFLVLLLILNIYYLYQAVFQYPDTNKYLERWEQIKEPE